MALGVDSLSFSLLAQTQMPQSLDEFVDRLDMGTLCETAGLSGAPPFPTFASEDLWPI